MCDLAAHVCVFFFCACRLLSQGLASFKMKRHAQVSVQALEEASRHALEQSDLDKLIAEDGVFQIISMHMFLIGDTIF